MLDQTHGLTSMKGVAYAARPSICLECNGINFGGNDITRGIYLRVWHCGRNATNLGSTMTVILELKRTRMKCHGASTKVTCPI